MIISNLSMIIDKRKGMTVYGLSQAANLPRTFIQGLYDNSFQMLNVTYLNQLCKFLKLDVNDIICYFPFDFAISVSADKQKVVVKMDFVNESFIIFNLDVRLKPPIALVSVSHDDFENWRSCFEHENEALYLHLLEVIKSKLIEALDYKELKVGFAPSITMFTEL